TIEWIGDIDGFVRLIDQTLLPTQLAYRDCRTIEEVWEAIKTLRVRGAPAIGVAAAMGVVVGMQSAAGGDRAGLMRRMNDVGAYRATSRPTAVNLFWALERMQTCFQRSMTRMSAPEEVRHSLLREALAIEAEDRAMCQAIGAHGADLVPEGGGV